MLSSKFEIELALDPVQLTCVQGVAIAAWLGGLIIIGSLSQSPGVRITTSLVWSALASLEYWRWALGVRQLLRLRFGAGGAILGLCRNGLWHELTLLRGSTVTRGVLWLRLAGGPGLAVGILIARGGLDCQRWRRLQVLLRCGQ